MQPVSQPVSQRAAPRAVHSIDHFAFSVPDLAEAERFYVDFGLDVQRQDGSRLTLRAHGQPHAWATLSQAPGAKQLQYLRWGIYAEDEAFFARQAADLGLAVGPHPAGDGRGLWLRGPDGLALQLVVAPKVSPSVLSPAPTTLARAGTRSAPARSGAGRVWPRHLSHLLLFTASVPQAMRFYIDVLGLRLSDHAGDGIAFLHGAHGSDHHLLALARSHAGGLHHSSWDVGSIHDVGLGAEIMRSRGWPAGWGVGRHVLGSNYFYYQRDPWGSWAEYSFDIDHVPAGHDWPAADHPPEDSFYVWGPEPPADFVTNHEHAAS